MANKRKEGKVPTATAVASPSSVRESFIRTTLKAYLPFWLQKKIYSAIKTIRLLKNKGSGTYTKEDLKGFLLDAGIEKGDVIMLHSSLGRIGFVDGGADALIDALLEVIGESGTLVMPTFSSDEVGQDGLYQFDARNTPCYTGAIPEAFRKRPGVLRSLSPLHSVAAYGKEAPRVVKNHELCDNPYAMNGPFGELYRLNAKIVQIGVDQLANSSIHIVEDKCKFPIDVFTKKLDAEVIGMDGKKKRITFRKHLSHLHKIRKNNIMEDVLLKKGMISIHPFGKTEIRVHHVKDLVSEMEKMLKDGKTIYGDAPKNAFS